MRSILCSSWCNRLYWSCCHFWESSGYSGAKGWRCLNSIREFKRTECIARVGLHCHCALLYIASELWTPLLLTGLIFCMCAWRKMSGLSQRKKVPRALNWVSPHRSVCWQGPSALGWGNVGVAVCSVSLTNLTKMFLTKNLFLAICVDTAPWKEGKYFSIILFWFWTSSSTRVSSHSLSIFKVMLWRVKLG